MGATILGWYVESGGNAIEYAYVTHTTQADLNQSPTLWTTVQLNPGSLDTNIAGVTATANVINNIPDGTYRIDGQITVNGFSIRTNVLFRVAVNGTVPGGPMGACDYIRSSQGHNTSSIHTSGNFVLNNGGTNTVRLIGQREANTGVITTIGNFGMLRLTRLG